MPGPHFRQPASPRGLPEPRCGESRKSGSEGAPAQQCAGVTRLVAGSGNSYIATLAERTSRFVMLVRVPGKDTVSVVSSLSAKIRDLPDGLMQSLTWDRGGTGRPPNVYRGNRREGVFR